MGNDGVELLKITVRMSLEDYAALEAEAIALKRPLATHCRDILHGHLVKAELADQVKGEVITIMESEEFDEVIMQKFLRAMERRKKN